MPYKKILVAYDGSKASEDAIEQAIMLARDNEATQLEVIHVYNMPTIIIGEAIFTPAPGQEKEAIAYSQAIVEKAKGHLKNTPHKTVTLHKGNPAKVILEQADETHCDLIVIGSRGHSGIKEFMLGSVSHNVVMHSKIPVLIVK
ncbi:universal stress protein [Paenibacillus psychroresistens]|uniref:Universal stress protein n=1 Tax=Paenibacillus psychroresistens TaxID=1778678 RepID=A0A6B8RTD3_9BACL|nr:universal stress protein [Paenibacillus psychroresistens]QGQ98713.1 universal stress protein [Paenibacillus psychroresistens]